jgi:hypothetical protein
MKREYLVDIPRIELWKKLLVINRKLGDKAVSGKLAAITDAINVYIPRDGKEQLKEMAILLKPISDWCIEKVEKYGRIRHPDYPDGADGVFIPSRSVKNSWEKSKRSGPVEDLLRAVTTKVHRNPALISVQDSWNPGRMIRPNKVVLGSQDQYGFLVTAVNEYGAYTPAYVKELFKDPTLISSGIISASYITNTINTVWARSGFILKVPQKNIFSASTLDLQTKSQMGHCPPASKYEEVLSLFLQARKSGVQPQTCLPGPRDLIAGMKPVSIGKEYTQMNEVAILGETFELGDARETYQSVGKSFEATQTYEPVSSKVEISGIFIMCGGKDIELSKARSDAYDALSQKHKLPIVKIQLAAGCTIKSEVRM